jgi:HD superfamily phosphohydrolase
MKGVETYQGRGLIADPIHRYILYTRPDGVPGEATEQDLIDSPWMQRLRRVPQLQSARWVFPAAEHSRFQHSLGAMHLAGRFASQLHPSLRAEFPDAPSAALVEELLRVAGLLHDIGHGPFGHFFDDNFLADFGLTHELVGQRIIREELADLLRGLGRSPSGPFDPGERIEPEWVCYLMGKGYTAPEAGHPRWLAHLKPLLSGIYTADNMDYVLRDSYMCGVAVVGPMEIERMMYYSFFSDKGLTLDRGGIQAFLMFLNARFYMYTNVYYHRTTRGIDLHLKEIFRDTMRLCFPYDLRQGLKPYLAMTEWTLLEEVVRWSDVDDPERKALGQEWRQVLDRRLKWRMSHEVVLDLFEPRRGQAFLPAEELERRVRGFRRAISPTFRSASTWRCRTRGR